MRKILNSNGASKKGLGLLAIAGLILVLGLSFLSVDRTKVDAAVSNLNGNVVGWMWSSNIGWLKLDASQSSPVQVKDNKLVGYAWSSNVGWVRFDPAESVYPGNPQHGVQIISDGTITGWARACSVYVGGCAGPTKLISGTELGGWDGWVKIEDRNNSGMAKYDTGTQTFSGFAWGALNLGWLRFWPLDSNPDPSCSDPDPAKRPANCPPYCVGNCGGGPSLTCTVKSDYPETPSRGDYTSVFTWTANPSNFAGPITYTWGGEFRNTSNAQSITTIGGSVLSGGTVTAVSGTQTLTASCPDISICYEDGVNFVSNGKTKDACCNGDSDNNGICGTQTEEPCTLSIGTGGQRITYYKDQSYSNNQRKAGIEISNCSGAQNLTYSGLNTSFDLVCYSGSSAVSCSSLGNGSYDLSVSPKSTLPDSPIKNNQFTIKINNPSAGQQTIRFDYYTSTST